MTIESVKALLVKSEKENLRKQQKIFIAEKIAERFTIYQQPFIQQKSSRDKTRENKVSHARSSSFFKAVKFRVEKLF